jgi:hypothetical protein
MRTFRAARPEEQSATVFFIRIAMPARRLRVSNLVSHDPSTGSTYLYLGRLKNKTPVHTIIDTEDYDRVRVAYWQPQQAYPHVYVITKKKHIIKTHQRLHRFILKAKHDEIVDHINGDTLDNRKSNLRIVTAQQNTWNSAVSSAHWKQSNFKGVTRDGNKWSASITVSGEWRMLGRFDTEAEAAQAYDAAALELFGEYARTNAMQGLYEAPRRVLGCG